MKTIQIITAVPAMVAALAFSSCNNTEEDVRPNDTVTPEGTTVPETTTPTYPSTGTIPPAGTSTTDEETLQVPEPEITTPESGQ